MRDPERQNLYGNFYTVSFPDFPSFTTKPISIVLHQAMGKHEIIELNYKNFSPFIAKSLTSGVPVTVSWSNDKVKGTFVGYTTKVSYPVTQTIERSIKVTCVAASYPLKDGGSKIWVNKTASEIVTEIATQFKLKPMVTQHPLRFSQQSLAGHSYWEKVVELADRVGYGVQCKGVELHFHPIDVMIDSSITTIPVLSFLDPYVNPQFSYDSQTLISFKPEVGEFVETRGHNRSSKVVSGINPVTGAMHQYTSSPQTVGKNLRSKTKQEVFKSVESGMVSTSPEMAKYLADGKAQLSRLSIPAEGTAQGDPRIFPWSTIQVKGTGDFSDGFWVVKTAKHTIYLSGKYFVEFTCGTDGTGSNIPSSVRPSAAGMVPTVNTSVALNSPHNYKATSVKLSSKVPTIGQTHTGFKVLPRRWVGR